MVKAAQPRCANQLCVRQSSALDGAAVRRVLLQRVVDSILMMVRHVVPQQSTQMFFAQCNDVVQQLTAATPDPSFCDSILPGNLHACAFRLQTCRFKECNHFGIELGVVIQNNVPIWLVSSKGIAKLLDHPICRER